MNVADTEGKNKPPSQKDLNADLFESLPTNLKLPELDKKSGKSAISMRKSQKIDVGEIEKQEKDLKKQKVLEEYKKKVQLEEEQRLLEDQKKLDEKALKQTMIKKRSTLKPEVAKFMANQEEYDSQPEEELDEIPEWLVDRDTYPGELEDSMGKPPFDIWKIMRG